MLLLAKAVQLAGKSKPPLARWIKSGRLSAARNESGGYEIASELARVFPFFAGDITGTLKQLVSPNP
jgi:predicted site-specific integrase-resolvase